MSDANRVVARLLDGTVIKGTTQDFFPNRPAFHILPMDGNGALEVRTEQLKALFFVRDLKGDSARRDIRGFIDGPGETAQGKKVAVRFKDGEFLCGYSLTYSPGRSGFFMFPSDSFTNNLRIYVIAASAAEIKAGVGAEAMAQRLLNEKVA